METRLKIATAASVASIVIAAVALTMSPANAELNRFRHDDDSFKASSHVRTDVSNHNFANVNNATNQAAVTGSVSIVHNDDTEGSAGTGGAANTSSTSTGVAASNSAAPAPAVAVPAVSLHHLDDFDDVSLRNSVKTSVQSSNEVVVNNETQQSAVSGSIEIVCNDDVESDVSTGDASNTSSTSTTINLSN